MKNFLTALLLLSLSFCNTAKKEKVGVLESETPTITSSYLMIKDALVATDESTTKEKAQIFVDLLSSSEDVLAKEMLQHAIQITKVDDVEMQRNHFNSLSESFYNYAKANDLDVKLYRQYCPMAFQNTGAYWVSDSKEIRNPYFGNKMLNCGSVKEEI